MRAARVYAVALSFAALRAVGAQDSLRFVGADAVTSRQVSQIIEAAAADGLPAGVILSKARFALAVHPRAKNRRCRKGRGGTARHRARRDRSARPRR